MDLAANEGGYWLTKITHLEAKTLVCARDRKDNGSKHLASNLIQFSGRERMHFACDIPSKGRKSAMAGVRCCNHRSARPLDSVASRFQVLQTKARSGSRARIRQSSKQSFRDFSGRSASSGSIAA